MEAIVSVGAHIAQANGIGGGRIVHVLVPIRVGQTDVDDTAGMVVRVAEELKPIYNADPPVLRWCPWVVGLDHATNC